MSTGYYPFKNLVFEGGGVKGIAYGGALEVLEQAQITPQIERVAGTSAGAITATMVSLNYTAAEFNQIMMTLPFEKFEDGSDLGGPVRLVENFGWFKGDYFLNLMESYIEDKTGDGRATFRDLAEKYRDRHFKDLYVFGTDLTQQAVQEFSYRTTPDAAVADAVRISMSIPFFFEARHYEQDGRNNVYCDGGVLINYPISTFDEQYTAPDPDFGHMMHHRTPNPATLGFHLDNLDQPPPRSIDNVRRFADGVFEAILNIQNILLKTNPGDERRTVFINNLGVKTTDFKLSDQVKTDLIAQGRIATSAYLNKTREPLPEIKRLLQRA
jgi:NTE family protein